MTFNAFHAIPVQRDCGTGVQQSEATFYLSQAVSRNHDPQASISIACVDFDLIIREILEYTPARVIAGTTVHLNLGNQ
jgi:hypothetical protein